MLDSFVACRFKMLTYYRVRSAFEAPRASLLNMICNFGTGSTYKVYQ